ncbi:hypothetical protein ACGFK1_20575 [Mycobacterium sp. NPDC048908]|uniref:hypothetical protein n=1 Tax=Mycobacterium sp. NPDC048908 TaxID=3364292 RepID=UPI00371DBB7B
MTKAKQIGCMWALAVALGVGMAIASTPAVAGADPGKGASSHSSHSPSGKKAASTASNEAPKPPRHGPKKHADANSGEPKQAPVTKVSAVQVRSPAAPTPVKTVTSPTRGAIEPAAAADPDFITSTHSLFGLFSVTSAADPDDNNYVAIVLRTPLFTDVLTSGTDPQDNLGFGPASVGVAGHTVNTFIGPFLTFSIGIPITDPLAPLFTELVRAGF